MKKTILLALTVSLLSGCMGVKVYHCGPGDVTINLDKAVSTSTLPMDLKARDVTVPISAIP